MEGTGSAFSAPMEVISTCPETTLYCVQDEVLCISVAILRITSAPKYEVIHGQVLSSDEGHLKRQPGLAA